MTALPYANFKRKKFKSILVINVCLYVFNKQLYCNVIQIPLKGVHCRGF